jgi:hypothetical protein
MRVGSFFTTSGAEGTIKWPLDRKKSRKVCRISEAVIINKSPEKGPKGRKTIGTSRTESGKKRDKNLPVPEWASQVSDFKFKVQGSKLFNALKTIRSSETFRFAP